MTIRKTLYCLFVFFCIWRFFLFGIAYFAPTHIPFTPTFSHSEITEESGLPFWVRRFANFDGILYILLAKSGYGAIGSLQAFFPLFPSLLHIFAGSSVVGSILLSSAGAFLLWCVWALFVQEVLGRKYVVSALLTLFLFPTSFFFAAVYTESLFLIFVLLSFLCARKNRFALASVFAALACATRLVGIFLLPALLYEAWIQKKSFSSYIAIISSSVGLLGFMLFLHIRFGDALAFFHIQNSFGAGRSASLVLYPQVAWRSAKILLTNQLNLRYLTSLSEFCAGTLGLVVLLLGHKKQYLSFFLFAVPAFFLPTLTGTFSSMPRYILVCFPLFLLLAKYTKDHKRIGFLWLCISTVWLIINTAMFIQGLWVS